jgi:MYXO-CTERM domain-containing protein
MARIGSICGALAFFLGALLTAGAGAAEPVEPVGRAAQDVWCIESTPCEADTDCPEAAACEADTRRVCRDDAELGCRDGESDSECATRTKALCEDEEVLSCQPRYPTACEAPDDCDPEYSCESGACRLVDEACESQSDCPEFYQCVAMDGGACDGGSDCVNGQLQVKLCIPPPYCGSTDADAQGQSPGADDQNADSGCSLGATTPGHPAGGALFTLAIAGLAVSLRRRRRS